MRRLLTNFRRDESGNFAMTAALMALPLIAVSGMAIDMNSVTNTKTANQDALDAAVLAAVRQPDAIAAKKAADEAYLGNNGMGDLIDVTFTDSATERSVSAKSNYTHKNHFGGILGRPQTTVEVKSKSVSKPEIFEVRIKPEYAKGTYRKTMRLFDVPANSGPVEVAEVAYYTTGKIATGTTTMTPDSNNYLTVTNPGSIYFTMDIDPTSEYIYPSTLLHMATNDPSTSFHLFVDGKQLPKGKAVNIAEYVPCGTTALFEWEDGGDFADQDFGFKVTGKCRVDADSPVALVE